MLSLSLRWKYIIGTTCIILIIIGVFSWQNLKLREKEIAYDDQERVVLITEIIKNGLITMMLEGRGYDFQRFLESVIAEDIREARIFKPDGLIISSSIPSEIGKKIYKDDLDRYLEQSNPQVFTHVRNKKLVYSMLVPIYNEPACQRCHKDNSEVRGILDIEISMNKTLKRLEKSRYSMIIFSVLTLITLSVSLSLLTKYLINRPLGGIIKTMKRVEDGDMKARFLTQRKDEIGRLSKTLNSMLTELDNARKEIEKYHQEEIKRVEKMATLGELAAAIAHEIKNPLAGISGAIQVFAEDFSDDDPRKEIIHDVIREIERLDKTVKDLLNFARPPEPHFLFTDVQSLIERLLNVISSQAQKQGVHIKIVNKHKTEKIFLDPEQFQQVFLNIALNGLHAMSDGGNLDIVISEEKDSLKFSFTDSGMGITEENMNNLFKPFFTTKQSGTGLGLAISKNIVQQHGGTINVESVLGEGSTFSVTIPVVESKNG